MIRGHPACCSQGGPRPVIGFAVETRREANKKSAKQAKKTKAKGDYGMDIKNSFQGRSSSISVNNDISNTKIVS